MYIPLISVIVPIYNREKTLGVCIRGILASKYKNIELILVDDGSTDNSLNVCKKYAEEDSRVVVVTQQNQGVSAARNTGIRHSRGEWISFIDSDDTVLSTYYENLVLNGDLEHVDLTLVDRCSGIIIDGVAERRYKQTDTITKRITGQTEIIRFLFGEFNPYVKDFYHVTNKLFRRDIIIENNIWLKEDITLGEDQIFVLEYLLYVNKFYYDSTSYYLFFNWSKEERTYGLGGNLRSPEYYLKIQNANYEAFERLYAICPDQGLKKYEVNYILDRPITRVLYKYTLFKNIKKYPYNKLRQFTQLEIIPLLNKESDHSRLLCDSRIARYNISLLSRPFLLVYLQILVYSNSVYYKRILSSRLKNKLRSLVGCS